MLKNFTARALSLSGLLSVLLGTLAGPALADQIVSVKTAKLELFAKPDDDKALLVVAPAGLPWAIKEERNAYFKVQVQGKEVWVDAMQVTVLRDSSDKCPPKAQAQVGVPDVVAASPGAAATRCR
ncbi:MAG: hypothetical protein ACEQSK_16255 [Sphingomonadaceae bacterium]